MPYAVLDEVVLRISGDDGRSWLQGQITADVGTPVGSAQKSGSVRALVLDVRGKILAAPWVLDRGEELCLRVPRPAYADVLARLERYLVMEDVDLDETTLKIVHSLSGPAEVDGVLESVPTPRLGPDGHDLLTEHPADVLKALAASDMGEEAWEKMRIEAGVPRWGVDFGLDTLPQEAGLTGHVSFSKGCYLGQEPVVMLQHRGKPPKKLVHLGFDGAPVVGDEVRQNDRVVGKITSASGRFAIAMVKRKALEAVDAPLSSNGLRPSSLVTIGQQD